MDGWGKELDPERSALAKAHTPFVDSLYQKYPNSVLTTFGEAVGLPVGQMGNSEVGHMNLGAGRVVYQELQRVNKSIESGELAHNEKVQAAFSYAKNSGKALHLMGLVSDGGVHSHLNHLIALCKYANEYGIEKIFVHCFMDGRDCAPESGKGFITELQKQLSNTNCEIASIIGRYYAMDRDKRWERISEAYHLLTHGEGVHFTDPIEAIEASYKNGVTDEFINAISIVDSQQVAKGVIEDDDAVICFNFRTDRCREITEVLTQNDMHEFNMHALSIHYTTMTRYADHFKKVHVIFEKDNLKNTLGEILSEEGKAQLRIAETEKYPHVSFFFSGGREDKFEGEDRIMVSSPKVATYDMQPEMSAYELKDKATQFLDSNSPDFMCLNFANTDMVGHTGIFEAAVKAAETVDSCVEEVVNKALSLDYTVLLTADHGNADIMINLDGTPHTSHTKNLVPLFLISKEDFKTIKDGKLGDIAPTILKLMGIQIPAEMTGNVLL
ncbi:MAG: 2,3-bisphosphoglycerate-independent phosphoglycerate mutase [Chitinophagales bacterium]|jgi:2,3-bisphosphoglycerate-independent phosphoglycerate mutase